MNSSPQLLIMAILNKNIGNWLIKIQIVKAIIVTIRFPLCPHNTTKDIKAGSGKADKVKRSPVTNMSICDQPDEVLTSFFLLFSEEVNLFINQ